MTTGNDSVFYFTSRSKLQVVYVSREPLPPVDLRLKNEPDPEFLPIPSKKKTPVKNKPRKSCERDGRKKVAKRKVCEKSKPSKSGAQKSPRCSSLDGYSVPKKRKLETGSLHSRSSTYYLTEDENSRHESEFDDLSEIESNGSEIDHIDDTFIEPPKISLPSPASLGIKNFNSEENPRLEQQFEDGAEESEPNDETDSIDIYEPKLIKTGSRDLPVQIAEENPSPDLQIAEENLRPEPQIQDGAEETEPNNQGYFVTIHHPKLFKTGSQDLSLQIVEENARTQPDDQDRATSPDSSQPGSI